MTDFGLPTLSGQKGERQAESAKAEAAEGEIPRKVSKRQRQDIDVKTIRMLLILISKVLSHHTNGSMSPQGSKSEQRQHWSWIQHLF